MTIVYTLRGGNVVDMNVQFDPKRGDLRRTGFQVGLDSTLQNINYWALGPWENYNDRRDGVTVGRYSTTPLTSMERYMKPKARAIAMNSAKPLSRTTKVVVCASKPKVKWDSPPSP